MTQTFNYSWTCKNCEAVNKIVRTKYEAAFDHLPKRAPCTQCRGTEYISAGAAMPEVDSELLEMWFSDPNLYFLDQDEDLIIANTHLDVLKTFLQKEGRTGERAYAMGPVLAVKLYDDLFEDTEERGWCINWLSQNKNYWLGSTSDYVIEKIMPMIDQAL